MGVGHLTSETFSGGPNNALSGSRSYTYDARAQQSRATLNLSTPSVPSGPTGVTAAAGRRR